MVRPHFWRTKCETPPTPLRESAGLKGLLPSWCCCHLGAAAMLRLGVMQGPKVRQSKAADRQPGRGAKNNGSGCAFETRPQQLDIHHLEI